MKQNTRFLAICGLLAAVFCVLGPITVPIGPIPVSLMTLALCVAAYVVGPQQTVVSVAVYLVLGAAGLPVFSGYQGGLAKLAGPTGGYLVGYLFLALLCGLAAEHSHHRPMLCLAGMVLGTAVLYAFGTAWFMVVYARSHGPIGLGATLGMCVLPFIIPDGVKIALALLLSRRLRRVSFIRSLSE